MLYMQNEGILEHNNESAMLKSCDCTAVAQTKVDKFTFFGTKKTSDVLLRAFCYFTCLAFYTIWKAL